MLNIAKSLEFYIWKNMEVHCPLTKGRKKFWCYSWQKLKVYFYERRMLYSTKSHSFVYFVCVCYCCLCITKKKKIHFDTQPHRCLLFAKKVNYFKRIHIWSQFVHTQFKYKLNKLTKLIYYLIPYMIISRVQIWKERLLSSLRI